MAEALSSFLAGLGASALRTFTDAFFFDYIRGTGLSMRTEVAMSQNIVKTITAEAMDSMIEGDPHPNVAISPSGVVSIMESFIKTVAQASLFLSTDIAGELYTEMVQQGFANAMQTTIAGALQSLLAVWRGGYPLSYDQAPTLIEAIEDIDKDTLGLLLAQSGSNVPTSFFYVKQGFDRYIENNLINLRTQLFEITNRLNDLISWKVERGSELALRQLNEVLNIYKEVYTKAISLIDLVCERALSRLQELKIECETTKAWLEWSEKHPSTPIISEDEANMLGVENLLEAQKVVSTIEFLLETIDDKLNVFDFDASNVVTNIDNCVVNEINRLNKMVEQAVWSVSELVSKIDEALNILVAYRNAVDLKTSPKTSLSVSVSATSEQPSTFEVSFNVKSDETPISGAKVLLHRSDRCFSGFTDENGFIAFINVPFGSYEYTVAKDGYQLFQTSLNVVENTIVAVNLTPLGG